MDDKLSSMVQTPELESHRLSSEALKPGVRFGGAHFRCRVTSVSRMVGGNWWFDCWRFRHSGRVMVQWLIGLWGLDFGVTHRLAESWARSAT